MNTETKRYKMSKRSRDKISRANKGRKLTEEHKQKLRDAYARNPHKQGWKPSEETRRKMSEAHKGLRLPWADKQQQEEIIIAENMTERLQHKYNIRPGDKFKSRKEMKERLGITTNTITNWKNFGFITLNKK